MARIQSVDRAMQILFAICAARSITPSDLAHGVVRQDRSGRYLLGPTSARLGNVYLDALDLRSRAAVWTAELARRTGLAVRTGVLVGREVMVVHHDVRPDGSAQMAELGMTIPAHACALGQAIVAFMARDDVAGLVTDWLARPMTGATLTDPELFSDQLEVTEASGLAWERDEAVLGESGLAAAVFDGAGVVGAIGVVAPSTEWPLEDSVADDLREAARAISRQLGAGSWPVRVARDGEASDGPSVR